ncbi:polar amino acid transport system substrate-binding protein [Enhydrobacter aerosaccus]|uniref:Polar amino acid transport system substrate-binding protein n=1 Tax=Enhydrobacter aerosaccus TaxID=225324 RepID=A0A1T4QPD1_9HYPH|nr:transporter substrate-binding domain-containing protein [Enhydrobacter aerosaccus]SKA05546.1 polar amino acid transport system substrate-binding protein [Enhydrobacter aerosaccus]
MKRLVLAALGLVMLASGSMAQTAKPATKQPVPQTKPAAQAKPAAPKSPFPAPAFKLTIATWGSYPPFNYLDRKGLPAGFEMDLAQEICQRMKAECEFVAAKWDDLIPGLVEKKFDIVMASLEVTPERRRRLGMSRRYYLSPGAFIAAKGAPFDGPPSLLRNKRIGVQKDSTHADWVDKSFRRSAQIKRYASVADELQALANGEVDAVFGDKAQLWLWSQKPEGQCCELVGQDIKDAPTLGIGVAAGIRREDVKLREAFNKALSEMIGDGTYKKLNAKYFPFSLNG